MEASLSECRVLIIDGNRIACTLLGALLDKSGIPKTEFAIDSEDGLRKVAQFHPDLVLLEALMPGMSGLDLCRQLRQMFSHQELPIIVQTAADSTEERNAAFAAGCSDFVAKPLNATELVAKIKIHLGNHIFFRVQTDVRSRNLREIADSLVEAINTEMIRLSGEIPNDPNGLDKFTKYMDFLKYVASELGRLSSVLDASLQSSSNIGRREHLSNAANISENLRSHIGSWIEQSGSRIIKYGTNIGLLGTGFAFLNWCGVPTHEALAVSAGVLGGKELKDVAEKITEKVAKK